ncbi:MAG: DeoR/GlpR family DNA-binding transcription regulator [Burkholderiaceae bacterium]
MILERLQAEGQVLARTLSSDLGVSEDTIRRDLGDLASAGLLQRVHGGALPASPAVGSLAQRRDVLPQEKSALGKAGAALIEPGQVVLVDGGTTARELIRAIPLEFNATIVTHSPQIAATLEFHTNIEVILIGGSLFRHSMVTVGPTAMEAIRAIRADIFFLGATGVHPEVGLSTGDYQEAGMKRALHARAAETIVLASSEKLGAASPYVILAASEISQLVVARDVESAIPDRFAAMGVSVIRAPVSRQPPTPSG